MTSGSRRVFARYRIVLVLEDFGDLVGSYPDRAKQIVTCGHCNSPRTLMWLRKCGQVWGLVFDPLFDFLKTCPEGTIGLSLGF